MFPMTITISKSRVRQTQVVVEAKETSRTRTRRHPANSGRRTTARRDSLAPRRRGGAVDAVFVEVVRVPDRLPAGGRWPWMTSNGAPRGRTGQPQPRGEHGSAKKRLAVRCPALCAMPSWMPVAVGLDGRRRRHVTHAVACMRAAGV